MTPNSEQKPLNNYAEQTSVEQDIRRLAARTAMSASTVRRWYKGERVLPSTRYTLDMAARKLRIPIPQRRPSGNGETGTPKSGD
jgi:transcriptional regulator with XRE-family HTH domain